MKHLRIGVELLRLLRQARLHAAHLRSRRQDALRRFVEEALVHSSFHSRRLAEAGIAPAALADPEQLARLPVMERVDVRDHSEAILNMRVQPARLRELRTSGSSGLPLRYWVTAEEQATRHALHLRACRLAGRPWLAREAVIGSKPPAKRPRPGQRHIYLSAAAPAAELRMALRAFAPDHLIAFPSTLMELGEDPGFSPQLITTGSEVLEPEVRRVLEMRFGARVRDIYGSVETGLLAFQCSLGSGYHLNEDEVVFEWLPAAGGMMELLVTPLHGRAMPLVRYRLGDMVRRLDGPCACGSTLARIASIEGRRDDWLLGRDGSRVHPAAIRAVFRRGERLFRYRVTQNDREVLLEMAADPAAAPVAAGFGSELETILGCRVQTAIVSSIQPDFSGKFRAIRRLEGASADRRI